MSPVIRFVALGICWMIWNAPFIFFRPRNPEKAVKVDPRARWGMVVTSVGFALTYIHGPETWNSPIEPWRVVVGVAFGLFGGLISWTAVRNLGRQWRFDAGLNANHELVQTGPYRFVRHPIYLSMLCMLLAGIALVGTLPLCPIGLAVAILGTEIRVRIEDGLLRERFGDRFTEWQHRMPAYIPLVR